MMGGVILERKRERSLGHERRERERSKYLGKDKTGSDLKLYIENAA